MILDMKEIMTALDLMHTNFKYILTRSVCKDAIFMATGKQQDFVERHQFRDFIIYLYNYCEYLSQFQAMDPDFDINHIDQKLLNGLKTSKDVNVH